jgi:hypothetical protein
LGQLQKVVEVKKAKQHNQVHINETHFMLLLLPSRQV